jgi:TetR/AcrR family transcriptional repressor of nem operon
MMPIMRYPDGHKQEVRERIVAATATALRKAGLRGVAIPQLMREVGLTHGGFYAHFKDRDELVAEAIEFAGGQTSEAIFARSKTLAELVDGYLSLGHVAHPEQGCVVAALGSEGPKNTGAVRRAFAHVASGLMRLVDAKVPGKKQARVSDRAIHVSALLIGGLVLARLVHNAAEQEQILKVTREAAKRAGS